MPSDLIRGWEPVFRKACPNQVLWGSTPRDHAQAINQATVSGRCSFEAPSTSANACRSAVFASAMISGSPGSTMLVTPKRGSTTLQGALAEKWLNPGSQGGVSSA
jgi:hypothetical protein